MNLKSVSAGTAGALGEQITRRAVRGRQCTNILEKELAPNLQAAANKQYAKAPQRGGLFPAARPHDGPVGNTGSGRRSPNRGGAIR